MKKLLKNPRVAAAALALVAAAVSAVWPELAPYARALQLAIGVAQ